METKKENDANQSIKKLHSHQEKGQNLLLQEATFFCRCPAQSLLKATQIVPRFHCCLVGYLVFVTVSCSSLCSILWQSSDHLALLFGTCIRGWCCEGLWGTSRIIRAGPPPLWNPTCWKLLSQTEQPPPEMELTLQLPSIPVGKLFPASPLG